MNECKVTFHPAFYLTIYEATCAGQNFSRVESLEDIADIYARFIIGQAFEK